MVGANLPSHLCGLPGRALYKTVLTHGFVLDEKGYKMSSIGNVIDPKRSSKVVTKFELADGADTLRLWISGVDYSGDVCIGDNIIKQVSDGYRKLRNTQVSSGLPGL